MPVLWSRMSSLSRDAVCPAAAAMSVGRPSVATDKTARGDAGHEWYEKHAPAFDEAAIREVARKHHANEDELLDILARNDFDPSGGMKEFPVVLKIPEGDGCPEIHVPGTLDWGLVHHDRDTVEVWDYKISDHPDYNIGIERDAQWHGYGVAFADHFKKNGAFGGKYFPVLGEEGYERIELESGPLQLARDWLTFIVRRSWKQSETSVATEFRPNQWDWSTGCKGCAAVTVCEAARREQDAAITLIGKDPRDFTALDEKDVAELYEIRTKVSAASRAASDIGKILLQFVDEHGPVPLDEKREIRVMETSNGRRFVRAFRKES